VAQHKDNGVSFKLRAVAWVSGAHHLCVGQLVDRLRHLVLLLMPLQGPTDWFRNKTAAEMV
jgi:hypothetical protein